MSGIAQTPLSGEAAALNERIAAEWPVRWEKANTPPNASKKRHRLRKHFQSHLRLEELRKQGAACATCRHYWPTHPMVRKERHCSLQSGGGCYSFPGPDGLCADWSAS